MNRVMKKKLLVLSIVISLFCFSIQLLAGEIYTYKKKKMIVITNGPLPDDADSAKFSGTYQRSSPQEIEEFQQRQKAAVERGYQRWQNSQSHSQTQPQDNSGSVTQNKQEKKIIRKRCPYAD